MMKLCTGPIRACIYVRVCANVCVCDQRGMIRFVCELNDVETDIDYTE